MMFPQIGETLSNGYTVLAAYCVGAERYVLAYQATAPQPYVVWSVDQNGETRNGSYFSDLNSAHERFAFYCFDWPEEQDNSATEDYAEEIIIRYDRKNLEMSVIINGKRKKDVKSIELKATDRYPPEEYRCTMYAPVPL